MTREHYLIRIKISLYISVCMINISYCGNFAFFSRQKSLLLLLKSLKFIYTLAISKVNFFSFLALSELIWGQALLIH